MGGRGRRDTQGHNDRVAGILQKPLRSCSAWALSQGSVSSIFPWEMAGLGTGLHSLPHPGGGWGAQQAPNFRCEETETLAHSKYSCLGGFPPPASPPLCPTLDPFSSPHILVGGGALKSPLQSSEPGQGQHDFRSPRTTALVWFSEEGLAVSWQGALEPGLGSFCSGQGGRFRGSVGSPLLTGQSGRAPEGQTLGALRFAQRGRKSFLPKW